MPPTGRAAKPTQKVAKADNWAASGESFGEKNSGPKTKAAAVAYRKKSYHSIDVPIQLAIATRTIGDLPLDTWVSLMVLPPIIMVASTSPNMRCSHLLSLAQEV